MRRGRERKRQRVWIRHGKALSVLMGQDETEPSAIQREAQKAGADVAGDGWCE